MGSERTIPWSRQTTSAGMEKLAEQTPPATLPAVVDALMEGLGRECSSPDGPPLLPSPASLQSVAGEVGGVGVALAPHDSLASEGPEVRGASEWLLALGALLALHGAAGAGHKRSGRAWAREEKPPALCLHTAT
jgi:hypothetical protein